MKVSSPIRGLHHVSTMCADPQNNVDFYGGILGLKLVKVTINYDDPGSYHLYYGDGLGRPGTLLTFFPWPSGPAGQIGRGQVVVTSFAVPCGALSFWQDRLRQQGVEFETFTRFNFSGLRMIDPDNMPVEIIESIDEPLEWGTYGPIDKDYAIHGFHHVGLDSVKPNVTERLLTETMNFRVVDRSETSVLLEVQSDVPYGRFVEISLDQSQPIGRMGTGVTHHVAFRVADDDDHATIRKMVLDFGLRPTEFIDRTYFHSIYFREPGAILFEIATDLPGNTVNEPAEELGTRLMLPPWLEPHRGEIAAGLVPFTAPNGVTFPGGSLERV